MKFQHLEIQKSIIIRIQRKMRFVINPTMYNMSLANIEDIKGGTPDVNAKIIKDILENKATEHQKNIVVLNSAVLLWIMDKVKSIEDGIKMAEDSIQSGKANHKLKSLVDYK